MSLAAPTTPSTAVATASADEAHGPEPAVRSRTAAVTAARRLRLVLRANAATSTSAAVIALVAPGPIADALGTTSTTAVRVVGLALLAFAVDTAVTSVRSVPKLRPGALAVSIGDVAWVLATPLVLAATDPTTVGTVVALVMAVGVAGFAALQLGLRARLPRR